MGKPRTDLIGKVFNNLKCLEFVGRIKNRSRWKAECLLCGNITIVPLDKIVRGHTKSCGCLKRINNKLYCQKRLFGQYRNDAKKRNLIFELAFEEFIVFLPQPCYYCGEVEVATYTNSRDKEHTLKYNGIDRLDSGGNYVKNNIVPCCKICNRMKMSISWADFLTHIFKIVQYRASDWSKL